MRSRWNPDRLFVRIFFAIEKPVTPHKLAMIREINRQRVLMKLWQICQVIQQSANVKIQILYHGVVSRQIFSHFRRIVEIWPSLKVCGLKTHKLTGRFKREMGGFNA